MSQTLPTPNSSRDEGDEQLIGSTPTVLVAGIQDDSMGGYPLWAVRLRNYYTVRTASTVDDVFEELDAQVDVVLIDARSIGAVTGSVLDTIREHDFACRVAVLSETWTTDDIHDVPVDASLVPPITGDEIQAVVERLSRYAAYDEYCQEYFDLVERKTTAEFSSPETSTDSNARRIERRIATVRRRMDRIIDDLVEAEDFLTTVEGVVHTSELPG